MAHPRAARHALVAARRGRGHGAVRQQQSARIAVRIASGIVLVVALAAGALIVVTRPGTFADLHDRGVPVLAHYMPWFASPYSLGAAKWGWHWTMDTRDPNVVQPDGQRQIASHFSPTIGAYDSSDPAVLRYHLLLMKYAGIDGVLIDWYGVSGSNSDVAMLQRNTVAMIAQARVIGLRYAVVYEDRFARGITDVQASVQYARQHWFGTRGYLRLPSTKKPYLGVFGPQTITNPAQWKAVVEAAGPVDLRTLWNNDSAGDAADGQFSWPYTASVGPSWADRLKVYYVLSKVSGRHVTAVGYPGYDDYYAQGERGGKSLFSIPYDGGGTLRQTLSLAVDGGAEVDSVQIATWNDFGEGTMVEPTVQRGFASLLTLQRFTGVQYGESDLQVVLRWYRVAATRGVQDQGVEAAFRALITGRVQQAEKTLAGN